MCRIAFLTRVFVVLAGLAAGAVRAEEPEVVSASLRAVEDGLALDADFAFELTPRLAEVVASGVPLYFNVEFELGRRRWYWFDEKAAAKKLQLRLSYHPLSRQYRLASGPLQQNYSSLEDALGVLRRVRGWIVVDRSVRFSEADYEASVRLRLDSTLLPKPFQVSALTARDLHLEIPWKRFIVHSPGRLRPPVEAPVPKGMDDR
jgi:hypothetical protein